MTMTLLVSLGWSFTFMKEGITSFLLLLYQGTDLPAGLSCLLNYIQQKYEFTAEEFYKGSVSIQTDTFVPYCMLEGISADTIWNENVVAFTDKEAVTLVPVENQKISRDGVRIYDIYHTYH